MILHRLYLNHLSKLHEKLQELGIKIKGLLKSEFYLSIFGLVVSGLFSLIWTLNGLSGDLVTDIEKAGVTFTLSVFILRILLGLIVSFKREKNSKSLQEIGSDTKSLVRRSRDTTLEGLNQHLSMLIHVSEDNQDLYKFELFFENEQFVQLGSNDERYLGRIEGYIFYHGARYFGVKIETKNSKQSTFFDKGDLIAVWHSSENKVFAGRELGVQDLNDPPHEIAYHKHDPSAINRNLKARMVSDLEVVKRLKDI